MHTSRNRKHGGAGARYENHEPLFKTWRAIKSRCYVKAVRSYADYGGRGIVLCERWQNYANFREDLLPGFQPGLQIDRIDNDKGYEPGNIKWSTAKEQARNRRTNRLVTAFGETHSLAEWCENRGLPYARVNARLNKLHLPPELALSKETFRRGRKPNPVAQ